MDVKDYQYIRAFSYEIESHDYIRFIEMPMIMKLYSSTIGWELYEYFEKINKLKDIKNEISIFLDEKYDYSFNKDRRLFTNVSDEKLIKWKNALIEIRGMEVLPIMSGKSFKELRNTYIDIISCIHPVISGISEDCWEHICTIYGKGDISSLHQIYTYIKASHYHIDTINRQVIDNYKKIMKKDTYEMMNSFPFIMKDIIFDSNTRSSILKEISQSCIDIDSSIQMLKDEIKFMKNHDKCINDKTGHI